MTQSGFSSRSGKWSKRRSWLTIVLCALVLVVAGGFAAYYVLGDLSADQNVHIEEKNTLSYVVNYHGSDLFDQEITNKEHHFLLGYTDNIVLTNSYSADFDKSLQVTYEFDATQTLIIRHLQGNSSGSEAPIVMEREYVLAEDSGTVTTNRLVFEEESYEIDLRPFQDTFEAFVAEKQENALGLTANQRLNFSAELHVNFNYQLTNPEADLNRTLERGVIIPITEEVYAIEFTGHPTASYDVTDQAFRLPSLFAAIAFLVVFVAATFGLVSGIKHLRLTGDAFQDELQKLLRKYSDDIVIVSSQSVSTHNYTEVPVKQFSDLLKISINLGKPITCRYDIEAGWAIFFILYDELLYEYHITRSEDISPELDKL